MAVLEILLGTVHTLGAGLDDIVVTYREKTNAKAWENYLNDLKKVQDIREAPTGSAENSESGFGDKKSSEVNWLRLALAAIGVIIVAAVGQGREYVLKGSRENNSRARECYEEAIALDPSYAGVYALLGWTHFWDVRFGWSESPGQSIKIAQELAQKSLALNDDIDYAHTLLGGIYLIQRKYEKSIAEEERALAICPNGAHNHAYMAGILGNSGGWEEGIEIAKKSFFTRIKQIKNV
jgi:tetratricopeptide (TPR) repeat protein